MHIRATVVVALAALTLAPCPPARATGREALEVHPTVDLPVTLGVGALYLTLFLTPHRQVTLAGDDPVGEPHGLDALGVRSLHEGIASVSDVFLFGGLALGTGLVAYDGGHHDHLGSRLLIYAETLVVAGAITELFKWAVRRPRPYTLEPGGRLGVPDDDLSFFSGHTSMSAAWAFGVARLFDLTHRWPAWMRVVAYGSAATFTVAMGTMRVLAGKHWPSDVLVGAAVGTAAGLLIPELHRKALPVQVALGPTDGGWRLSVGAVF